MKKEPLPKVNPRLSHHDVEYRLPYGAGDVLLENTGLYTQIRRLVAPLEPSMKDEYDTRWNDLYLPLRRGGREIAVPMSVMLYQGRYFVSVAKAGHFRADRGKQEIDPFYGTVVGEAARLLPIIRRTSGRIIGRLVPYDYRRGRVKGKYIMGRLMPRKEAEGILGRYRGHAAKNLRAEGGCSLNEYLSTAAVCYTAAYGKEKRKINRVAGRTPLEMYKSFADGRHGGMLDIRDADSRGEFAEWYRSGEHAGSHPFEIVFSWSQHGIHLYPPAEHNGWRYGLWVTNYGYAGAFVKMARALMRRGVPFAAHDLEDVLDYLTGEAYFTVNEYDRLSFNYYPSREYKEKYFKKIAWEPLKLPRWRGRNRGG